MQPAFMFQGISCIYVYTYTQRERERRKGERKKEREREREKERKEGKKETVTQALMEQRCFNQHGVGIYTVLQGSFSQQR